MCNRSVFVKKHNHDRYFYMLPFNIKIANHCLKLPTYEILTSDENNQALNDLLLVIYFYIVIMDNCLRYFWLCEINEVLIGT